MPGGQTRGGGGAGRWQLGGLPTIPGGQDTGLQVPPLRAVPWGHEQLGGLPTIPGGQDTGLQVPPLRAVP